MSRYPRRCRNGHEITGPELELRGGGCRVCARLVDRDSKRRARATAEGRARRNELERELYARNVDRERERGRARVRSGKHAEIQARYRRRRAEARDAELELELRERGVIPRSGVETKTKFVDTVTMTKNTTHRSIRTAGDPAIRVDWAATIRSLLALLRGRA